MSPSRPFKSFIRGSVEHLHRGALQLHNVTNSVGQSLLRPQVHGTAAASPALGSSSVYSGSVETLTCVGLKSVQDGFGGGQRGKHHVDVGVPDMSRMKLPASASATMSDAILYRSLGGRIEAIGQVFHSVHRGPTSPGFRWQKGHAVPIVFSVDCSPGVAVEASAVARESQQVAYRVGRCLGVHVPYNDRYGCCAT